MEKERAWNLIAKKLSGEASSEELLELETVMRLDPDLHYSMQAIHDLWQNREQDDFEKKQAFLAFWRHLERMQALGIEYPAKQPHEEKKAHKEDQDSSDKTDLANGSLQHPLTAKTHVGSSRLFRRSALALAILAGIFLLGAAIFKSKSPAGQTVPPVERNNEISTRNGSRTNLLLPDGTRVWLNAGSKLTYDKNFGVTIREVSLTGEAFFDVACNAEKPFIIHTDRMDIKVLGTSFNIRSYPSDKTTEATLVHGSIEISIRDKPGARIILKPNEKLIVANEDSSLQRKLPGKALSTPAGKQSSVTIRKPTYEENTGALIETSWVDNKLIFQGEEFGALAKDLERWYGVSIRFTEPSQEHLRFTGTFQKETVEQALDALKMIAGFTYTIEGTQISIFTKE